MDEFSLTKIVEQREKLQSQIERFDKNFEEDMPKLKEKYNTERKLLIDSLKKVDGFLSDYSNSVIKNSTFDAKFIGGHIEDLMSKFEGVRFMFQKTTYTSTQRGLGLGVTIYEKVKEHIITVVKLIEARERYEELPRKDIVDLESKGNALILYRSKTEQKGRINFYSLDLSTSEPSIKEQVNYNGFDYVKDFVDNLIAYRLDNKTKTIPDDFIEKVKANILLKSPKSLTLSNQK